MGGIDIIYFVTKPFGGQYEVYENFQPENDILIEMNDVNVGWDNHKVLRHLNWTFKRGEHWLIRGPNGSGKTTLLELITGCQPLAVSF